MKNVSPVDACHQPGFMVRVSPNKQVQGVRGVRGAAGPSVRAAGRMDKKPAFAQLAPQRSPTPGEAGTGPSGPAFPGNPLLKGTLETYILNFALNV